MSTTRLPNFFLVGAPKAATTSVYSYLGQHQDIFTPDIKEPHYFSCPEVKDTYYDVPFVDNFDDYADLYSGARGRKAGDFSPSYLFYDRAAERIRRQCPDAQIMMILRNPVDRAARKEERRCQGYSDEP